MTEPNELTVGGGAVPGRGRRRAVTAAMVAAAMLSAQAAFAGYAGAQATDPDCPTCPTPTPPPCPSCPGEDNPPAPTPPPDNGGGGNGGGNGAAFVPGTFIQLGTGFPFGSTTTVDYGAFPASGFGGGFTVSTQPPGATVDLGGAGSTGGIIDSTFDQAGLE